MEPPGEEEAGGGSGTEATASGGDVVASASSSSSGGMVAHRSCIFCPEPMLKSMVPTQAWRPLTAKMYDPGVLLDAEGGLANMLAHIRNVTGAPFMDSDDDEEEEGEKKVVHDDSVIG